MNNFYCGCRFNCTILAVIVSILVGIITSFLRITGVITLTPAFLWVLFGIAILFLLTAFRMLGALGDIASKRCICPNVVLLLVGIVGTVFGSVILLGITFVATSVIGAIIAGGTLFLFSLMIILTACLVKCAFECYDD